MGVSIVAGFCYLVFLGLRALVGSYGHVLWPLAIAGVLALLLRPWVARLERKIGAGRRGLAVIIIYAVAALLGAGLLLLLVPTVLHEAIAFVDTAPDFVAKVHDSLIERYPALMGRFEDSFDIRALGRDFLARVEGSEWWSASAPALARLQSGVGEAVSVMTGLAIIPVYLYFFLLGRGEPMALVERQLGFLAPRVKEDVLFLIKEFVDCIVVFFRGQIIIGSIMGVLLAAGFTISGLRFGLVLGLVIGFLNIVPYLGTILGLSVVIPVAMFQQGGGTHLLALCMVVFVAVQLIEGYLLTPRIMGEATGLHPMVIIVAIFFWGTALGGILGMVFAIPLTAFGVVAWRLFRLRVLAPLLSSAPSDAPDPDAS